ncbi:MAG: NUDIX hydrolase-like protein [Cytophagales bacterium]|jgi:ADP-ribose pyrophosphatase YjhB (NUDIX family)|nr:NUDIX domain-containing protein [Bacteroidota bacterium]MBS1979619.1 NUDIX domain-containing protein [Bacteroidota bacterium]WHZ09180.1 MAG: NUDIX hydrolase-like protein [Cytophagales bacterium]
MKIFYVFACTMNLFVNDIPVKILKPGTRPDDGTYNAEINAASEAVTKAKLINHLWVSKASVMDLDLILDLINSNVPIHLLSLVITVKDYAGAKNFIRKKFKVVKAAGGLVLKKDKMLMIYRLKKWDLPKGKKESNETYKETAVREVEEECGIEVRLGKRIGTTWHTYTMNKSNMIKKTRWYKMELVSDAKMRPATEEDIEELRWMTQKEVYHALENSYRSIRFVFEEFYRKRKIKS